MKDRKGFTLIELILTLSISSLIFLTLISVLKFTVNSYKLGEMEDELILNGKYVVEFIKKEIRSADKIISSDKIEFLHEEFGENVGFVVMKYNNPGEYYKYNYSTYYLKDNKIIRVAANTNNEKLPRAGMFRGYNEVAEHIVSIEGTKADFSKRTIDLNITLGDRDGMSTKFSTTIFIRCPVLY